MPRRKTTGAAGKPAADTRPIHQRGQTWQAVKLTGNRAQRGNLPGGAPRFVYEVLWQGGAKTYEPADCLVSWGKEMKAVDEACGVRALMPQINPAAEARRARELAAKKKAEELEKRRADLQRQQRQRARCARMGDALEDDEDEADHLSDVSDASDAMEDDHDASEEQLAEELRVLEEQLQRLAGGAVRLQGQQQLVTMLWIQPRLAPQSARQTGRCRRSMHVKVGHLCGRRSIARRTSARSLIVRVAASATSRQSPAQVRVATFDI